MTGSATALVPSTAALQDAAIETSLILRDAKVDAPLRAKAVAAILLATVHQAQRAGERFRDVPGSAATPAEPAASRAVLAAINRQVTAALAATNLSRSERTRLTKVLRLGGSDYARLAPYVPKIQSVLQRLDLGSALNGEIDFLGIFYEAFLRYGYDNNALGIVFTPRHLARFCVELIGAGADDRVIDLACGTGGFLVAAHAHMQTAKTRGEANHEGSRVHRTRIPGKAAGAIFGFDTNPTVWALALLNMLFRMQGAVASLPGNPVLEWKLQLDSCFAPRSRTAVRKRFTRAFLNPPFSQAAEPERDFIDATMEALEPGGLGAVVVKAGIFADNEHTRWRAEFTERHTVLGVISLPEDVFYPTAVPASILLAKAHVPQPNRSEVLLARVWNDGFEKLKNQRVERAGCELPEIVRCFHGVLRGERFRSHLATTVKGVNLKDGAEWSPQEWLPQPPSAPSRILEGQRNALAGILQAVAEWPELADVVSKEFTLEWQHLPALPLARSAPVADFFHVLNGRSAGEKRYQDGAMPYISSGGRLNSIVRLVEAAAAEVIPQGGITVTAFGQAAVQPWPFLARGNGGSSVRVLLPRYRMGLADLTWFAAQINAQRWRFFYARMAIQSRLERLVVNSPPTNRADSILTIAERVRRWHATLTELSDI